MSQVDALLTKYSRRRGRRDELREGAVGVVIDVFMFRRMITPWLIRIGFVLLCLLAVWTAGDAVIGGLLKQSKAPRSSPPTVGRAANTPDSQSMPVFIAPPPPLFQAPAWMRTAAWQWIALLLGVCAVRVVCESMIVVFQINESVTDVRKKMLEQVG